MSCSTEPALTIPTASLTQNDYLQMIYSRKLRAEKELEISKMKNVALENELKVIFVLFQHIFYLINILINSFKNSLFSIEYLFLKILLQSVVWDKQRMRYV